jgi:hypothetical protein
VSGTDPARRSPAARVVASQIPRSISSSETRLPIRGNPENRFCKQFALQPPKTGKFDYFYLPNHPAHSMICEFFTDDYLELSYYRNRINAQRREAAKAQVGVCDG